MTHEDIEMLSILGMMRADMKSFAAQREDIIPQLKRQMNEGLPRQIEQQEAELAKGLDAIARIERGISDLASGEVTAKSLWDSIREQVTPNGHVLELCERYGWEPPPARGPAERPAPDGGMFQ